MTWTCDYDFKLIMENVETAMIEEEDVSESQIDREPKPFEDPNILDAHLAQLLALQEEVDQKVMVLKQESERLHELTEFFSVSLSKLNET